MPWCRDMTWEGVHFWERALRGFGDGEADDGSSPPGGTQIMTFFGGRGGECFAPGIQGSFIGWQESREEKNMMYDRADHFSWGNLGDCIDCAPQGRTVKQC